MLFLPSLVISLTFYRRSPRSTVSWIVWMVRTLFLDFKNICSDEDVVR